MKVRWMRWCLLLWFVLLMGCSEPVAPSGSLSVTDLLKSPVFVSTKVYGRISALRELNCPCFLLESGEGETKLQVWYGLMSKDGQDNPNVSIDGLNNGDWVVVTGELQKSSGTEPSTTFWSSAIEPLP